MIFTGTSIGGVIIVDIERHEDERGFFARTWCRREFETQGLNSDLVQCSMSSNRRRGTLRGLHYQAAPHQEDKLVRCTRGAVYDVALDLRHDSPTFMHHVAVELTESNARALFIPPGVAHGFQTLLDDTQLLYQMSEFYAPGYGRGVRWNDPAFGISWPIADPSLNDRDAGYPDFTPGS